MLLIGAMSNFNFPCLVTPIPTLSLNLILLKSLHFKLSSWRE